ncbi:tail fiber protein [Phage vB_KsaM-C1]|nr:tail fiber protein [Phage vB_KsaM-C1]
MALKRNERYPNRFDNPSTDHPQGAFKNRTSPSSQDGSYLEKDWANDWDGFFARLLAVAGITPNGNVDTAQASQYYDALLANFGTAARRNIGTGTNQVPDMSSQGRTLISGGQGGVQYFPNGLIRQWGTSSAISASGASVTQVFPVAFPTAVHQVRTFDASNPNVSVNFCMVDAITLTQCRIWAIGTITAAGPTLGAWPAGRGTYWEAWGH